MLISKKLIQWPAQIHLSFLCCVFLNGPSNRLHGRMQSRTGCICLTFLHCVFLNAVSDCLNYMKYEWMDGFALWFIAYTSLSRDRSNYMKYNHTCCMVTCGDGFSPLNVVFVLSQNTVRNHISTTPITVKMWWRGFSGWDLLLGLYLRAYISVEPSNGVKRSVLQMSTI